MTSTLPIEGSTEELRTQIAGRVISPTDEGYDENRLAWNRSYEHRPTVIVMPNSAADVAAAVAFAARLDLPIGIQATGHGVATPSNGSMLILTHHLDDVTIDRDAWTARVGAGAKWSKVMGPASEVGLAPLLGSTPEVSAVGYTLGGGMGWMARKYGLSADHVRSMEIVTADGRIRRVSPERDPELFWALRGGGAGSLGVVTAMEIDLVPVTSLYAGNLFYPASMAREVAARYRDWVTNVPEELTSSIAFMNFPPIQEIPEPLRGRSFAIVRGGFLGSDDSGESLLRHWRDWRSPEIDAWGRIPFSDIATISNDPVDPMSGLASTNWLDILSDGAIDTIIQAMFEKEMPTPLVMAEIRHAGGAISRDPDFPNAYGNRAREHLLEVIGVITPDQPSNATRNLVSDLNLRLQPFLADGAYLNFLEGEEKVRRTQEGFDAESWETLLKVKKSHDPNDLFRYGIAIR